jgi:serine/threonine-protein kinase
VGDLAIAVYTAVFLWVLYVALEPYVRKRWSHRIISWSRLIKGDYRDPLVGRDILIGAAFGSGMVVCAVLSAGGPLWLGRAASLTFNPGNVVIGQRFVGRFVNQLTAGVFLPFICLFLLLLFVAVLRRELLAFGALWLLLAVVNLLLGQAVPQSAIFVVISTFLSTFALYRYGLLACVSAMFLAHLWVFYPVTTELTAWYARDFVMGLVIALALVVYAFYISLAGQSLFGGKLFQD